MHSSTSRVCAPDAVVSTTKSKLDAFTHDCYSSSLIMLCIPEYVPSAFLRRALLHVG